MEPLTVKLSISIALVISAFVLKSLFARSAASVREKYGFREDRLTLVVKSFNLGVGLVLLLIILGVWEVGSEDLALYFASVFAVIGVAFFAQWSHLSNVTGALILYFCHSIKIGDEIEIMDKDLPVKGIIKDVNLFFIIIQADSGKNITLSNTLFLQKVIGYSTSGKSGDKKAT